MLDITDPAAGHAGGHHLPLLLRPGHDGEEGRHHGSLRERSVERHETVRRPHLPRPHSSHRTGRLPPPHYHGSGRSRQGTNMALSLKKPRTICFSPVLTIFFYSTLTFKYVGWEKDKQNLLKNRLATGNDIMK